MKKGEGMVNTGSNLKHNIGYDCAKNSIHHPPMRTSTLATNNPFFIEPDILL